MQYYAGTSGLLLPFPKYRFPTEHQSSSRLTFYSSLYSSIEINSSFYKLPVPKTIAKWSSEVSPDFLFTFKLWKEITHTQNLNFKESALEQFMTAINQVGNKRGCLLIQFPPSLKSNHASQLFRLLGALQKIDPQRLWPVALEFRNRSWYNVDIFDQVESFQAAIVIHDKTGSATPPVDSSTDFVYVRFHGPDGDYRGNYSDDVLAEHAGYIKERLKEKKRVFVYFNNTMGQALSNLNTLNRYILNIGG